MVQRVFYGEIKVEMIYILQLKMKYTFWNLRGFPWSFGILKTFSRDFLTILHNPDKDSLKRSSVTEF